MTMTGSIITSMAGKPARGIVKHGPCQFLSMLLLNIWGCSFGGPGCLRTAVEQDLVKDCVSKYIWISVRYVTWGAHGHGTRSVWTNSIKSPGRFLTGKTSLNHDGEWLKPIVGDVSVNAVGSEIGWSKQQGRDACLCPLVEGRECRTMGKWAWSLAHNHKVASVFSVMMVDVLSLMCDLAFSKYSCLILGSTRSLSSYKSTLVLGWLTDEYLSLCRKGKADYLLFYHLADVILSLYLLCIFWMPGREWTGSGRNRVDVGRMVRNLL